MINKYIALSALACAAILPLSTQAQTSNSADADVNITLVQPIAVEYVSGTGRLGTVVVPASGSYEYYAKTDLHDSGYDYRTGTPIILVDPEPYEFDVTGGAGLNYSVNASMVDADDNDGVTFSTIRLSCLNQFSGSHAFLIEVGSSSPPDVCVIQNDDDDLRVAPFVEISSSASVINDAKVGTLTVAVAYE